MLNRDGNVWLLFSVAICKPANVIVPGSISFLSLQLLVSLLTSDDKT